MARKRKKNTWNAGELNLTAMIDVAFQLLSFFIITAHPIDVLTKLSVLRPRPDANAQKDTQVKLLTVMVLPDRYMVNERIVSAGQLESSLAKLAALDSKQMVLIQCINQSPHKQLIKLLDICSKLKLTNLSVVSSGGA